MLAYVEHLTRQIQSARLAQLVEHQTFNLRVAGSSPSSGAKILKSKLVKDSQYWS